MQTLQNTLQLFYGNNNKTFPLSTYLHLIFEISSVTRFFSNFEISSLKNRKINLIWKLIFAGYKFCKFELDKKSSLFRNRFFFEFVINSQIDISKIKHRWTPCVSNFIEIVFRYLEPMSPWFHEL